MWHSLKRIMPQKRHRPDALERAYRIVFTSPEGETVLADLAAECGMYQAPPESLDPRQSGYVDGRKAMFARILHMIRIPPEEHAALQEATRLELLPDFERETDI